MNPHLQDFYAELDLAQDQGLIEHKSRVVMYFNSTRSFYEDYNSNEPLPTKYAVEITIQVKNLVPPETHNSLTEYLQNKYQLNFVPGKNGLVTQLEATKEDLQRLPSNVSRHIIVGNQ